MYIHLNPSESDIGPIMTLPKEIPKSAHAINNPNNMLRPTLGKTKLR